MSKTQEQELLLAAHDLQTRSPEAWRAFATALTDYATAKCIEAVQSPVDAALVAHGRAQALLALNDALHDLDGRVEAIKKGRSRQNRP